MYHRPNLRISENESLCHPGSPERHLLVTDGDNHIRAASACRDDVNGRSERELSNATAYSDDHTLSIVRRISRVTKPLAIRDVCAIGGDD